MKKWIIFASLSLSFGFVLALATAEDSPSDDGAFMESAAVELN